MSTWNDCPLCGNKMVWTHSAIKCSVKVNDNYHFNQHYYVTYTNNINNGSYPHSNNNVFEFMEENIIVPNFRITRTNSKTLVYNNDYKRVLSVDYPIEFSEFNKTGILNKLNKLLSIS